MKNGLKRAGLSGLIGTGIAGAGALQGRGAVVVGYAIHETGQNISESNSLRNSTPQRPTWTGNAVNRYQNVLCERLRKRRGTLSIFDEGVQFMSNEGYWVELPYTSITDVQAVDSLPIFADVLTINTRDSGSWTFYPQREIGVVAVEEAIEKRVRNAMESLK